jgi:ribonuclease HI
MASAHERVVVHVDGGSRGNPGPAAVGAVATSPEGETLAEAGRYIGEETNNVAEYKAVLLGLELAHDLGAREVEIVNDSQLVARQIGGEYKVKNKGLMPLFRETMAALRQFDQWAVRDVRREHNVRADELVNEALDEAAARR